MNDSISTGLSHREVAALTIARLIAKKLIKEHPEISSDYQNGAAQMEIAEKCGLLNEHTASVSRAAVRFALKEFLSSEELQFIFEDTLSSKRARAGQATFERGVALFGLDDEARKKRAAKSLATQIREKIGIHARSAKEKTESGRKLVKSNGMTLWTEGIDPETGLNELEYALILMENPEYIHKKGKLRNHPDYKKITAKLNEIFHQGKSIRTTRTVSRLREKKGVESRMPKKHPGWTECIHPTIQLNEVDYLILITNTPGFQTTNGRPHHAKIAKHLNDLFHGGEEVRTEASVRTKICRSKQKKD